MDPPCQKKTHHPGTTPIGRQDEEEKEVRGGGNIKASEANRGRGLTTPDITMMGLNIGQMKLLDPNFHFRKAFKMKLR